MRREKRHFRSMENARKAAGFFGWARVVRSGHDSGSDGREAPLSPQFVSSLREKSCPDRSADRYRTALDGKIRLDRTVQTVAGGSRVGVEDALINKKALDKE